ncbi:MAG: hypothetical protein J6R67_01300 [Treponema sp.]|nr:hypothetical protein [Treponema sp.]
MADVITVPQQQTHLTSGNSFHSMAISIPTPPLSYIINTYNTIIYITHFLNYKGKKALSAGVMSFLPFFHGFRGKAALHPESSRNLIYKEVPIVAKKAIKPVDNHANQKNANKGTKGQNRQHSQVHGNRSKQLQQNHTASDQLGK